MVPPMPHLNTSLSMTKFGRLRGRKDVSMIVPEACCDEYIHMHRIRPSQEEEWLAAKVIVTRESFRVLLVAAALWQIFVTLEEICTAACVFFYYRVRRASLYGRYGCRKQSEWKDRSGQQTNVDSGLHSTSQAIYCTLTLLKTFIYFSYLGIATDTASEALQGCARIPSSSQVWQTQRSNLGTQAFRSLVWSLVSCLNDEH